MASAAQLTGCRLVYAVCVNRERLIEENPSTVWYEWHYLWRQEGTETSYTERGSLPPPSYTDCIIIVQPHAGIERGRTRNRRAWRQTISSFNLYDRRQIFTATVRRKSFSSKEKQIWVIRGKKIRAKGKNRKRPSLIQRKSENLKKKRSNKCPLLSGDLKTSTEVVCQLLEETIQTVANGGLTKRCLGVG